MLMNIAIRRLSMRLKLALVAALAALAVVVPSAQAVEKPSLKFTLEWAFQGPQAVFSLAADKNFFKNEGLNVQVDRGSGSTDAVVRVASGTYDFGWAELSSVVKYNAENPGNRLVAIYVTHEHSANAVIAIRGRGVAVPKDLEGKKVGSTAGSAARDIFDTFAKANGIDASKVKPQTVSGALRETMLVRNDVDAILGAITSGVLTIQSLGIKRDDIVVMPYGDFGVELYGHAVITTAAFAEKNPQTVAAVARAVNNALKAAIADPKAAVATLSARDKLTDLALEQERLVLMLQKLVLTQNAQTNGLSAVAPDRMRKTMQTIYDAYGVKAQPDPATLYTDKFLPPQASRVPPPLKP
jgi:NitT/TauT family transport system substrate-binding protein